MSRAARRWGRRLVGTAMLGVALLLIRDWDAVGVISGFVAGLVGVAAWEASFK